MTQVGKQFHSNRHDGEASCADDGENDIRTGKGLGLGHPYEDNEACRYDGDNDLQGEKEVLRAIQNGRRDSGGDKTDDDEDGAANAGLVIREAIRDQDLVEKTGDGVEDADVDGEGDKDEP